MPSLLALVLVHGRCPGAVLQRHALHTAVPLRLPVEQRFRNGVSFGVAHRIPYVISDGADGDVFPAGCFALIGFASDDIAIAPDGCRKATHALCTARSGVANRTHADLHVHALFTFTPSSLPPTIFAALRAQECAVNRTAPLWNPRRNSVAVHISEPWHVLTSHKKCTNHWFAAHPRFIDLEGFLRVPVSPREVRACVCLYLCACK